MTNHTEALHRAAAALRYCLTVIPINDPLHRKIEATELATRRAALDPVTATEATATIRARFQGYGISPPVPLEYELTNNLTKYVHVFKDPAQLVEFCNHEKMHVTNPRELPAMFSLDFRF